MAKLKSFISYMFESKWEYSENYTVRTHKKTGKVEYDWPDDWGHLWFDEPMP